MAEIEKGDERRRNPRFICVGEAKINPLPSDGALVSGKLRNLSMGGICVETDHPIDLGTRTEILLNVDAVSFRTLAMVRSISNRFRTNMEFVQMSAGSRDILGDVLEHMSRVQKIMRKIRSAPLDAKVELSRELQELGVRMDLGERVLSLGKIPVLDGSPAPDSGHEAPERTVGSESRVIRVDLFG